jgi:hypothetical protein
MRPDACERATRARVSVTLKATRAIRVNAREAMGAYGER